MHSIWQEQMEFPVYPILKRDKKTDILYAVSYTHLTLPTILRV